MLAAASMSACVGDLDTLPLNSTEPVVEYVYGNSEEMDGYRKEIGQ